eukprot:4797851-Prymnesium_polylepis.1
MWHVMWHVVYVICLHVAHVPSLCERRRRWGGGLGWRTQPEEPAGLGPAHVGEAVPHVGQVEVGEAGRVGRSP